MVRNKSQSENTSCKTDLSNLSAKIEELLPGGNETNYNIPKNSKKQLLILSGAYPQPGWGVLVEIDDFNKFNYIIEEAILKTYSDKELTTYRECTNLYYEWRKMADSKRIPPNFDIINKSILIHNELRNEINQFLKQDKDNAYNKNNLNKIDELFKKNPLFEFRDDYISIVNHNDDLLRIALSLKGMTNNYDSNVLNNKINEF
ncbi:MAG: hypothetical protein IPN09_16780 [Bacteroidetes bacterium]|nr:hypothetical protein [Bacteroidota bacterium]